MRLSNALVYKAVFLAERAFKGKLDKGGFPYIGHLYRVASRVEELGGGPEEVAAAMLHDLLEDTKGFEAEFAEFPYEVRRQVESVTRRPGESYALFMTRVLDGDVHTIRLKLADMKDNMDPARNTEGVPNSRYAKWFPKLSEIWEAEGV